MSRPTEKQALADDLLPDIANIPYAVERDHWVQLLADTLRVDAAVLREDARRLQAQSAKRDEHAPKGSAPAAAALPEKKDRLSLLAERALALALAHPAALPLLDAAARALSTSPAAALYEQMKKEYTATGTISRSSGTHVTSSILFLAETEFAGVSPQEAEKEMRALAVSIAEEGNKQRRAQLQAAIAQAEKNGNEAQVAALLQEFQHTVHSDHF